MQASAEQLRLVHEETHTWQGKQDHVQIFALDVDARPEVKAFVKYYLTNATTLADAAQFVPAPQKALDEALARVPA